MNSLPGASGALIDIADDQVTKLDSLRTGARVREQGLWLKQYTAAKHLPNITQILPNGYEMEKLDEVEIDLEGDPLPWIRECMQAWITTRHALRDARGPLVDLDRAALLHYVIQLGRDTEEFEVALTLIDAIDRIQWIDFRTWTHGDPIVANLMLRGDIYVLTDPIPPCPAVPSLAVVDYGRFIQSAAGYEQIRYTDTNPPPYVWQARVAEILNACVTDASAQLFATTHRFDVDLARAAMFYAVIHMLRGARTATGKTRDRLRDQAQLLTVEFTTWMR